MVPKPPPAPYPPTRHHHTTTTPPSTAQKTLQTFLTQTHQTPHLHPDSLLTAQGITYAASSGPKGGLALHHLARVEAALRGENLALETREELEELFGGGDGGEEVGESDDRRLDGMILESERRKREEIEAWAAGGGGEVDAWGEEGEIGDREEGAARVVEQGGEETEVLKTEAGAGEVDRDARKAAKKARRKEENKRKAAEAAAKG